MDPFTLHPRLAAGTHELGRLGCSLVLLKDNALFPWLLVVPEVTGIEDIRTAWLVAQKLITADFDTNFPKKILA